MGEFVASVQYNDRLTDTEFALSQVIKELKSLPFPIVGILPGAETGVELCDRLNAELNLLGNDTKQSSARRNKFIMGEAVRSSGIRAVKQAICTDIISVLLFLEDLINIENKLKNQELIKFSKYYHYFPLKNFDLFTLPSELREFLETKLKCVVKPVQSAGTDDVFLCNTVYDAVVAFSRILGKINGIGILNNEVLVQEFLKGQEYVVDKVSYLGEHKIVAVWKYDKRPVNGAAFVYFGMKLVRSDEEFIQILLDYADKVLDAVGIKNGPSHMEVMLNVIEVETFDEKINKNVIKKIYDPCLVEVGARCHGGEGTWLGPTRLCIGYNQLDVSLDIVLDRSLFNKISKNSYPNLKAAREVDLVARQSGILRSTPGEGKIRALKSFYSMSWEVHPGEFVNKTIDCFTRPGCIQLVAESEEQADADLEEIHRIEVRELLDFSIICPTPLELGTVVIVDPYNSGINLAASILKWGYKLVLVFNHHDINGDKSNSIITKLGNNGKTTLLIKHNSKAKDQDYAINTTLNSIVNYDESNQKKNTNILAILPGSFSGIKLAEELSNLYGTRSNFITSLDYRTCFLNQLNNLTLKGFDTLAYSACYSTEDIESFFKKISNSFKNSSSLVFSIRPILYDGENKEYICNNFGSALEIFSLLNKQINSFNQINHGVIIQSYNQNNSFSFDDSTIIHDNSNIILDGVIRDGIFKATAIWQGELVRLNNLSYNTIVFSNKKLINYTNPNVQHVFENLTKMLNTLDISDGSVHIRFNTFKIQSNPSSEISFIPLIHSISCVPHGDHGNWIPLVDSCIGYNQIDSTLNCYLRPDRYDSLSLVPKTLTSSGIIITLVNNFNITNFDEKTVLTINEIIGLEKIRSLPSFLRCELYVQPGSTIDLSQNSSQYGSILLQHINDEILQRDCQFIQNLKLDELFKF